MQTQLLNCRSLINCLILFLLILMPVSCSPTDFPDSDAKPTSLPVETTETPEDLHTPQLTPSPTGVPAEVTKIPDALHTAKPSVLATVVLPDMPELPLGTAEDAILAVKSEYPSVVDISDTADDVIGKSNDIYILPHDDDWRLIFWKGWGDCPAGCLNSHYWYFCVTTDGAIELVGEYERVYEPRINSSVETGEPLWGIPR